MNVNKLFFGAVILFVLYNYVLWQWFGSQLSELRGVVSELRAQQRDLPRQRVRDDNAHKKDSSDRRASNAAGTASARNNNNVVSSVIDSNNDVAAGGGGGTDDDVDSTSSSSSGRAKGDNNDILNGNEQKDASSLLPILVFCYNRVRADACVHNTFPIY